MAKAAIRRDLNMDDARIAHYLEFERRATVQSDALKRTLGDTYAGHWIEPDDAGGHRLVFASTDPHTASRASVAGERYRFARYSHATLEAAKSRLDRHAAVYPPQKGIDAWYVDVRNNRVAIAATPNAKQAAFDFAAANAIDPAMVDVVPSNGIAQPLYDAVGGDGFYFSNAGRCTIGFTVFNANQTGYVTAGHCARTTLYATRGLNQVPQGEFVASHYPDTDYAWVRITNTQDWRIVPTVMNYSNGFINVVGKNAAPVGANVCRYGVRTGARCGTITATNVTVTVPSGFLYGMTETNACAGQGDSGGPFITLAGQAQGVTSTGTQSNGIDNCGTSVRRTYFQPLQPILDRYGLTLATAVAPTITSFVCPINGDDDYACSVAYQSVVPATVTWSGGVGESIALPGGGQFLGTCSPGQQIRITVNVTNAYGTRSRTSAIFSCPSA
jgi:streptogrisin C